MENETWTTTCVKMVIVTTAATTTTSLQKQQQIQNAHFMLELFTNGSMATSIR